MSLVTSSAYNHTVLSAITGTAGALATCSVALFSDVITPTPQTVLGDLTELSFDGYARSTAISWSSPYLQSDGSYASSGDVKRFQMTGTASPVTVTMYGMLQTVASVTSLVAVEALSTPVYLSAIDDAVLVVPQVAVANAGSASASIIS